MTINTISIQRIQNLRDNYTAQREILSKKYGWHQDHDGRASIFGKYINLINALQISHWYFDNCLTHSGWYDSVSSERMADSNKAVYLREYDAFTKIGTVQIMMLGLDSSFRLYVRTLDSSACNGGTSEFQGVFQWLFKRLSVDPAWTGHVEIIRMIRNTVHNNGVYYHKDGKDREMQYANKTYKFQLGKHIGFVTWELLINWLELNLDLLKLIVESSELSSISQINDPYILSAGQS